MALFNGVENFNPAFEGQRIAIGAGQGAGQSISRGMSTALHGRAQSLDEAQFAFKKKQYYDQLQRLDLFKRWLDSKIGESPTGFSDWTD